MASPPRICIDCGCEYTNYQRERCPDCHLEHEEGKLDLPSEADIAEECRKIREAHLAEKAAVVGGWSERPGNIRCYGKRVSGRAGSGEMVANRPRPL